jgi:hypothetical protein
MLNVKSYHCFTRVLALCAGLLVLLPCAMRGDVGLTVKTGTLGVGADLTFPLITDLNLRVGGNYFQYDYSATNSKIKYDAKLNLGSGLAVLDWHPFSGSFRLSGGVLANGNKVDLTGKLTGGTYTINGNTYTAAQVDTLTGRVSFNGAAPYLGIGWGNAIDKRGHWSVAVDLGAAYQGKPKLTYTTNGTATGTPTFQSDLNVERNKVQHALNFFTVYPVISLGISYKF